MSDGKVGDDRKASSAAKGTALCLLGKMVLVRDTNPWQQLKLRGDLKGRKSKQQPVLMKTYFTDSKVFALT